MLNLSLLDLLVLALATWRLAYLISRENAPFNIMGRFRERFPLGGGVKCIYCTSIWTAVVMLLLWFTPLQPIVWVFAVSGGALMLGSYTGATQT